MGDVSWSVIITITVILIMILIRFAKTLFQTIFNDNTDTDSEIKDFIKKQRQNPEFQSIDICLEASKRFDFTIAIHCKVTTVNEAINEIKEIRDKIAGYGHDKERTEVIYIIPEKNSLSKRYKEISMNVKHIRFLQAYKDPFQEFKRCVLMARGKVIINSEVIEDELAAYQSYPNDFVVLAKPARKCSIPFYDPLTFSYPVFASKGSGMLLYSRVHIKGVQAAPELAHLCMLLKIPLYTKTYRVRCHGVGVISCLSHRIIKWETHMLYKYGVWTPNKKK